MSGISTPRASQTGQQPKQMSSRLMTMKFMQRAVANTDRSQSQPNTPSSEPALKRQKTDSSNPASGTSSPSFDRSSFIDRKAINDALRADTAAEALARARNLGDNNIETQWVLPVNIPVSATSRGSNDVPNGEESESDNDYDDIWSSAVSGRQTYGSLKHKKRMYVKKPVVATTENNIDLKPVTTRGFESSTDSDSGSESGEVSSSSENVSEKQQHKVTTVNYDDAAEMARLDKIDLSRSSYAKSKGSFMPSPKVGFGQRDRPKGQAGSRSKQLYRNKSGKKGRKTL